MEIVVDAEELIEVLIKQHDQTRLHVSKDGERTRVLLPQVVRALTEAHIRRMKFSVILSTGIVLSAFVLFACWNLVVAEKMSVEMFWWLAQTVMVLSGISSGVAAFFKKKNDTFKIRSSDVLESEKSD